MRIGRTALELPAFARPSFGLRAFALPRPIRRGGPSGIVAAVAIVVVVSGALLMAALPGVGATPTRPGPTGTSVAAVPGTTEGERTPAATPEPTDRATASATPAPTVEPAAVPPGDVADLCDIFFDIPCALAPGRYAPSRVVPAFDVELGEGWSSAAHAADSVVFTRAEGAMTFAGRIAEVYPNGEVREPRARPRAIIEAFIATNGVSATRPANVRIDGRRGLSTDLTPIDSARVELFATAGTTYFLEPDLTTRVVVMDLRDDTILLAIEPHAGYDLEDILETADVVAGTIRWR